MILPPTPLQEGMIAHWLAEPASDRDTVVHTTELHGPHGMCDTDILTVVWDLLVQRFRALRCRVDLTHHAAGIEIDPMSATGAERSPLPQGARSGREWDLIRGPLVAFCAERLADDRASLVWRGHHLAVDGWSRVLVLREFVRACDDLWIGQESHPLLEDTFPDVLRHIAARPRADIDDFWTSYLGGETAAIHASSEPPTNVCPTTAILRLEPAEAEALTRAARGYRVTVALVAQVAWGATLAGHLAVPQVVVGEVTSGRSTLPRHLLDSVGMFASTLPAVLPDAPCYSGANLRQWQRDSMVRRRHEHPQMWVVKQRLGIPPENPLYASVFAFENYPATPERQRLFHLGETVSAHHTGYGLTLRIHWRGPRPTAVLEFDPNRFVGAELLARYRTELARATEHY